MMSCKSEPEFMHLIGNVALTIHDYLLSGKKPLQVLLHNLFCPGYIVAAKQYSMYEHRI